MMMKRLRTAWVNLAPLAVLAALLFGIAYVVVDTMGESKTRQRVEVTERTLERVVRARCAEGVKDVTGCQQLLARLLKNATPTQLAALKGPQGARGPRGERGPRGVAGSRGATGQRGAVGPRGAQGPQGATGATGTRGPVGPPGASIIGPAGSAGPAGESGLPGRPGCLILSC